MTSKNHHQNFIAIIIVVVVTVITQLLHLYKEYMFWHSERIAIMCTYLRNNLQTLLVKDRHLMLPLSLSCSSSPSYRTVRQIKHNDFFFWCFILRNTCLNFVGVYELIHHARSLYMENISMPIHYNLSAFLDGIQNFTTVISICVCCN